MIRLENVCKDYRGKSGAIEACRNVSIEIDDGEIFGIIGFSGAGKSTLIRCINLLERPTSGRVFVDGRELTSLGDKELRRERRNIGMIFQQFNLLMQKTAMQNICFPLRVAGVGRRDAEKRARELLELVGLPDRADAYPSQLSGGQKQRVAIARALATNPKVLLCDEATSALDPTTTRQILALLKELNEKLGITVVIITHAMSVIAEICGRVAIMENGEIVEQGRVAEVFERPRTAIARRLIFPEGQRPKLDGQGRFIRVVFDDEAAFEPIIGRMVMECRAPVSILYAKTTVLDGRDYGHMVLQLPDDDTQCEMIKKFLSDKNIRYSEELKNV